MSSREYGLCATSQLVRSCPAADSLVSQSKFRLFVLLPWRAVQVSKKLAAVRRHESGQVVGASHCSTVMQSAFRPCLTEARRGREMETKPMLS